MQNVAGMAIVMAVAVAGFAPGGTAQAQEWREARAAEAVCSGQRAGLLEQRLGHEVDEGDIDPGTAARIHAAIDRLEDRQRHECDEGDWRAIGRIGERYGRIENWIDAEAGRLRWQAGW